MCSMGRYLYSTVLETEFIFQLLFTFRILPKYIFHAVSTFQKWAIMRYFAVCYVNFNPCLRKVPQLETLHSSAKLKVLNPLSTIYFDSYTKDSHKDIKTGTLQRNNHETSSFIHK